jgi:hypothetical protein
MNLLLYSNHSNLRTIYDNDEEIEQERSRYHNRFTIADKLFEIGLVSITKRSEVHRRVAKNIFEQAQMILAKFIILLEPQVGTNEYHYMNKLTRRKKITDDL